MIKPAISIIRPALGACLGCACAGKCGGPKPAAGLGALGCSGCSGCPNAGKCGGARPAGLGFTYAGDTGAIEWLKSLDWRIVLLLVAVVVIIAQNVFFSPGKVADRRARRQKQRAARERYQRALKRIEEGAE